MWIWQSSEYVSYKTLREVTLQVKLVFIERWPYSEPCQRSKLKHYGKIIIACNYFHKKVHLKSLRGFCICVVFLTCQGSDYLRIVKMSGFWISRVTQGLLFFVDMARFWMCVRTQLWKGSEYSRIPNMLDFCICKRYARFSMSLNMAD